MSETQHSAADFSGLPANERAGRYRELAEMHLKLGGAALVDEARAGHLELAALWTRLARQAETAARLLADVPDEPSGEVSSVGGEAAVGPALGRGPGLDWA